MTDDVVSDEQRKIDKTKRLFDEFDSEFQKKIIQSLLSDKRWARQMLDVLDVEFFSHEHLRYIVETNFSYFMKYKDFPTVKMLATVMRENFKAGTGADAVLLGKALECLSLIKNNPESGDLGFVKERILDFCKRQAFKIALEHAIEDVLSNDYETVVKRLRKAMMAGSPVSAGHDFFEDFAVRFDVSARKCVRTGLVELDGKTILNGGLAAGELGTVLGATGVGKSHFLVMLGANALRDKKNVLHYTFELSECSTALRYDSNLCSISSTDVVSKKDEVIASYETNDVKFGRLFVKEYPSGFATVNVLRTHAENLQLTRDFIPDVIMIDYADVMRSSHRYDSLRHELKLVYEDLRSWATERKIPIWTASQVNREGSTHEVVELRDISEAYGKAMVADVVLTLSRKLEDRSRGSGRLYVAKNRAGSDGLVFSVEIDTATSVFRIIDEYSLSEARDEHDREIDSIVKKKWLEMTARPSSGNGKSVVLTSVVNR